MVSNQIIQKALVEIATITNVNAAIYGNDGNQIAAKGDMSGIDDKDVVSFIVSGDASSSGSRFYFNRICQDGETEYISAVKKDSDNALMASGLLKVQFEGFLQVYRERMDKDSFIKNLLLDNLLQIDIFNRSRKLHIEFTEPRTVYIIKSEGRVQQHVHEVLKQVIAGNESDFITGTDENNQIVVHSIRNRQAAEADLMGFAEEMLKAIRAAGMEADIAYGSVVNELKDVSKSYKEARLAHDVRSIFYEDRHIISYSNLGIGRLIYQLPINLCRMFISEIFGGRTLDEFDEETLATINKFFENNLNVSETSRQLFIHRNTLVYRLDKLQKQTGLDLRVFEDAITFKIALMVVKYIDYMDRIDY